MIRNKNKKLQRIHKELTQKGFRWTKPREHVLEVFINQKLPITPAEVLAKVGGAKMNFSSVYRTIELFCKEGVLTLVDVTKEGNRFVLTDKYRDHLHYLTCQLCNKTISFKDCFISEIEKRISHKFKFKIATHDLKLLGSCENCS